MIMEVVPRLICSLDSWMRGFVFSHQQNDIHAWKTKRQLNDGVVVAFIALEVVIHEKFQTYLPLDLLQYIPKQASLISKTEHYEFLTSRSQLVGTLMPL